MRLGSRARARRGNVLVTYAMLFFALLGVAAVVIDLGTARLTQTLMQSATDTAAVEGLRYRDPATGKETSTAVVAPIASATVSTAINVNPGCLSSCRKAN